MGSRGWIGSVCERYETVRGEVVGKKVHIPDMCFLFGIVCNNLKALFPACNFHFDGKNRMNINEFDCPNNSRTLRMFHVGKRVAFKKKPPTLL